MGINSQFQTVIYNKFTGDIIRCAPNQYIKSKDRFSKLMAPNGVADLRFFYWHSAMPVDPAVFKVFVSSPGSPPRLVSNAGDDATLLFLEKEANFTFEHYRKVAIVFEGGMGDYLDQADVVIALHKKHPEILLTCLVDMTRAGALQMLEGLDGVSLKPINDIGGGRSARIEFSSITKVSPAYPPGGKNGVYSAIAGLDQPAHRCEFALPSAALLRAKQLLEARIPGGYTKLVALHTMSGNTNTKSIVPSRVGRLIAPLLKTKGVYVLHFGGAGETPFDHPRVISLQGSLSWVDVVCTMSFCDACLCIDSAIMHIAQHLGLRTLALWGPTVPGHILGEDSGVTCIRSTATCRGCNQYDCDHWSCMDQFDSRRLTLATQKLIRGTNAKILPDDVD